MKVVSNLEIEQVVTPSGSPAAGFAYLYFKGDGKLYKKIGATETAVEGVAATEAIEVQAVDPTETDDLNAGYFVGQRWINSATNRSFIALSVAAGAAVWGEITPTGGISTGPGGELIIDSGVSLGTAITATINGNVDNLAVPNIETAIVLRLNTTGNYSITGLAPFNSSSAWMVFIANVGTGNITLKNNDAASTAENRFLIGGNKTIQTDEGLLAFYDPISTRWRGSGILI